MSLINCACCSKQIDLDVEDYAFAEDSVSYLCEECCEVCDE